MAWTIEYTDSARSALKKLDKQAARRILDYMDERIAPQADARHTGKALKGPFGDFWRYRVGDYRLICEIKDKTVTILVLTIGNRKDVY